MCSLLSLFLFSLVSFISCTTYVNGPLFEDTLWSIHDSPFILDGDVVVHPDVKLQIESGVKVVFQRHTNLYVRGILETAVNYEFWRQNTVFESDDVCTRRRERKLPVYPIPSLDENLNQAVAVLADLNTEYIDLMNKVTTFVNGELSVKVKVCCKSEFTQADFETMVKKFEEVSGLDSYPNAGKYSWEQSQLSMIWHVSILFKEDAPNHCGSLVVESDIARPKLYISRTDFIGLLTAINGTSDGLIEDISIEDCDTAFVLSLGSYLDPAESTNCVRCRIKNVRQVIVEGTRSIWSKPTVDTFNISASTFSNSQIELPEGVAISHSLFKNTSLIVGVHAKIFQSTFENCSVYVTSGFVSIQDNHFYDTLSGMIIQNAVFVDRDSAVRNNTFSRNKFGVIFVHGQNSEMNIIDYETMLETISTHSVPLLLENVISTRQYPPNGFTGNTIQGNEYGVIVMDQNGYLALQHNKISANDVYNLVNFRRAALDASHTNWGTCDPKEISNKIWDACNDGFMGLVHFSSPVSNKPHQ